MAKERDKTARRKSGKRGIGPADGEVVEITKAQGEETNEEEEDKDPDQAELIKMPPPPPVKGKRMGAFFVSFKAKRNKNRERLLKIRFTLELTEDHEGLLPKEIEDEWRHFRRGSVKNTEPEGMSTQNIELVSVDADKMSDETLKFTANIEKAKISKTTVKGQGGTRKVTRLDLHIITSDTKDLYDWCHLNNEENVYLKMKDSNKSIEFDGDEESEE